METISHIDQSLFATMMEKLPAAALLLDRDFNFIYSNPSFHDFSGLSSTQIPFKGWSSCLDSSDTESLLQTLSDLKEPGSLSVNKPLRIFKTKDGHFSSTATITPIPDGKTSNLYMLTFSIPAVQEYNYGLTIKNIAVQETTGATMSDYNLRIPSANTGQTVTTLDRTEEYINDLIESNKLKDKILAIISHDIRSPITSLKGLSANFLDEELTNEERRGFKESLLAQLDAVSYLTENLLRWATLSFLKKDAKERKVLNLFEIVKQNIELVNLHALSKNIQINNDIPEEIITLANKDQIDIVIRNLISNAIKYTPVNGTVNISGVDLKTHTQICISDTGIGISKDRLNKLFTYSHSNTYGTNGEKGTGLGLMLCKEYVEFNGGKISVSSEVNIGTTIVLELPDAAVQDKFNNFINTFPSTALQA